MTNALVHSRTTLIGKESVYGRPPRTNTANFLATTSGAIIYSAFGCGENDYSIERRFALQC